MVYIHTSTVAGDLLYISIYIVCMLVGVVIILHDLPRISGCQPPEEFTQPFLTPAQVEQVIW